MTVFDSPIRRLLVALFAAWLPLACCCRALAADADSAPGAVEITADHSCCGGDGSDTPADSSPGDPGHTSCSCDGQTAVTPGGEAVSLPPALPVGLLPFWGDHGDEPGISVARQYTATASMAVPRSPAPTLRALCVLLTV